MAASRCICPYRPASLSEQDEGARALTVEVIDPECTHPLHAAHSSRLDGFDAAVPDDISGLAA